MAAYYNEIDPYAAAWLRNLIAAGHIADGDVDERSIEDVRPDDLRGYKQCHFFAGIGVWSHALRRASWPDDRHVWTGSCPCQPFSAAGKGEGFTDERHLWPAWFHLIVECDPTVVFGEQVASKDADPWIDLVQTDMEALDYAFGAIPFPSAGVGAPHIRDRLYWMAYADDQGSQGRRLLRERADKLSTRASGMVGRLADATRIQPQQFLDVGDGNAAITRHSFWDAADWIGCEDGRWRPVEPGASPLAHGASGRVGRLRAYGNAINAEAAFAFIVEGCAVMAERGVSWAR